MPRSSKDRWLASSALRQCTLAVTLLVVLPLHFCFAQGRYFRESFDTADKSWQPDQSDAAYRVVRHERSTDAARQGERGERIVLDAGRGSTIHFRHSAGAARLIEELVVAVWVKSPRNGVQLAARVVLPHVTDPATDEPLALVVTGQRYVTAGKWQQLRLDRMPLRMQQQITVARARLRRDFDLAEAYVESALLNLHTGKGRTEVLIDDLEVGPYVASPYASASATQEPAALAAQVTFEEGRLSVNGRPMFLRMVRHQGESLANLRAMGFNAVWSQHPDAALLGQAGVLGVGVVTAPPAKLWESSQPASVIPASSLDEEWNAVYAWYVGGGLGPESLRQITSRAAQLRSVDPKRRPIAADVVGPMDRYSSELDLLGVRRWPLMGGSSLREYRDWLLSQSRLARPGALLWTWIQTSPPKSVRDVLMHPGPDFDPAMPMGPTVEPEQIRLMTYAAVSAGYRGLGFWTSSVLGQSADGPDREPLLCLSLLNLELRLLEPWLATGSVVDTVQADRSEVEAAIIRTNRGSLVVPVWYERGTEFVPGQQAARQLTLVVPGIPSATPAWEITGTEVRLLKSERVSGGLKVTLEDFGLTSVVLFSGDAAVVRQLRREVARRAPEAARLQRELASAKLRRVTATQQQLEQLGHGHAQAQALLQAATKWFNASANTYGRGEYGKAQRAARRCMRALRILQRSEWEAAVAGLSDPAESPFTLCYNTLPDHWRFQAALRGARIGPNLLRGGGFEDLFRVTGQGWRQIKHGGPTLQAEAELSPTDPYEGQYSLRLSVATSPAPSGRGAAGMVPLTVVTSPLRVTSGQMLRISGWVRKPGGQVGGTAAVLQESATAAPASLRWWQTEGWQPFTLYRPAPASGRFELSLVMPGVGDVYFDDLAVEPIHLPNQLAQERAAIDRQ